MEIVPLFYLENTIEKVEGMRPYTPLELAGRDIYVREGCYVCHSQMIRPMRDEVERYGHYSLAAESMYDHPFQWGSKRTGPDLARVGGRYSDDWHVAHMIDPRAVVPELIMPAYPWLAETPTRRRAASPRSCAAQPRRRRSLHRRDDRRRRAPTSAPRPTPTPATSTAARALSQGAGPQLRRPARGSPRWTRSSPICRCSARWSTSRPSSPTRAAERHGHLRRAPPVRRQLGRSCSW